DDGTDHVEDLVPSDERVRYVRLGARQRVGAKRNVACGLARGELIAHWDDDDWYAPNRLALQVGALLEHEAEVCGASTALYHDLRNGRAWRYVYPADQPPWLAGGSLVYTRASWRRQPFADIDVGEDAYFVWARPAERVLALADTRFYVGSI